MLLKNTAGQSVPLYAVDTTASPPAGKAGDRLNITGFIAQDHGAEVALASAPDVEIGGGTYWQPLSQAETNANVLSIRWVSATAGVVIDPLLPLFTTGVNLPVAAPGANGGLPTVNGSNLIAGVVDRTGYSLAATGLDAIPIAAPAGIAGTFREMIVQLWRKAFKKSTLTSTQLKTYADDDTAILTTQTAQDDGITQTLGKAT